MKQLSCPRCLGLFERSDRFCKKCGLRKSKPFSRTRWWLVALLTNLLIVLLFAALREKVITAEGYPPDITTEMAWFLFGFLGLLLLLPTFCVYPIYRILWLRKRGLMGSGEVIAYHEYRTSEGTSRVAIVKFTPDLAQTSVCQVKYSGLMNTLSMYEKVKVLYDPYNPGGCAWVGSGLVDLILFGIFGLIFASAPISTMVLVLQAIPTSQ